MKKQRDNYKPSDFKVLYYDRTGNYIVKANHTYLRINKVTGGTGMYNDLKNATVFNTLDDARKAIDWFFTENPCFEFPYKEQKR